MFASDEARQVPGQGASTIIPQFRSERVRIPDQFDPETGLPLYRTMEIVRLLIPGDKGNAPEKKVNDAIKHQYRKEYDLWKSSGKTGDMEGTGVPLAQWPQLPKEIASGLIHANVFTVEQLSNLSDAQCQIRGTIGLRKYRDMAMAFVDASRAAAPIAKLATENEALERRVILLEQQLTKVTEIAESQSATIAHLKSETPSFETPDLGKIEDE